MGTSAHLQLIRLRHGGIVQFPEFPGDPLARHLHVHLHTRTCSCSPRSKQAWSSGPLLEGSTHWRASKWGGISVHDRHEPLRAVPGVVTPGNHNNNNTCLFLSK